MHQAALPLAQNATPVVAAAYWHHWHCDASAHSFFIDSRIIDDKLIRRQRCES
jgi:hypothetical protein